MMTNQKQRLSPGDVLHPQLAISAAALVLAMLYTGWTVDLAQPSVALSAAMAVAGVGVTGSFLIRARRRLAAVRRLAEGGPGSSEPLRSVVAELFSLPDRLFVLGLQHWGAGGLLAAVGLRILNPQASLGASVRVLGIGICFGLLSCLLGHLFTLLRCRRALVVLSSIHLTPAELVELAPTTRPGIRLGIMAYTAILVAVPTLLSVDIAARVARTQARRVVDAPTLEEKERIVEGLTTAALPLFGGLFLLVLGYAAAASRLAGAALADPMRVISHEASQIAQGRFGAPRLVPADAEFWQVTTAFTRMQTQLSHVLTELQRAGVQLGSTSEQIVATSSTYEAGATDQATSLNETSATTEELARSARQIAENAASVSDIAQRTVAAAHQGEASADAFSASMGRMKEDTQAIASSVVKLSKRVKQIGRIVEFINGIADKSDLLALSAELEGTKAGEVGRGFSLVAGEIRRLAENVIESTKEIELLIEEIRDATTAAVTATQAGVEATDSGAVLATSVSGSLKQILDLAAKTSDAVKSISLATQQQQTGTDQLAEGMFEILQVTDQSLKASREVTHATTNLSGLTADLKSVVERFRVS